MAFSTWILVDAFALWPYPDWGGWRWALVREWEQIWLRGLGSSEFLRRAQRFKGGEVGIARWHSSDRGDGLRWTSYNLQSILTVILTITLQYQPAKLPALFLSWKCDQRRRIVKSKAFMHSSLGFQPCHGWSRRTCWRFWSGVEFTEGLLHIVRWVTSITQQAEHLAIRQIESVIHQEEVVEVEVLQFGWKWLEQP